MSVVWGEDPMWVNPEKISENKYSPNKFLFHKIKAVGQWKD